MDFRCVIMRRQSKRAREQDEPKEEWMKVSIEYCME